MEAVQKCRYGSDLVKKSDILTSRSGYDSKSIPEVDLNSRHSSGSYSR